MGASTQTQLRRISTREEFDSSEVEEMVLLGNDFQPGIIVEKSEDGLKAVQLFRYRGNVDLQLVTYEFTRRGGANGQERLILREAEDIDSLSKEYRKYAQRFGISV